MSIRTKTYFHRIDLKTKLQVLDSPLRRVKEIKAN